jgi:hypothetical protein
MSEPLEEFYDAANVARWRDSGTLDLWREAVNVLAAADRGEASFERGAPWEFCGYPTYRIRGWTFAIFDDCASWDYIEWAESPDGRRITTEDGPINLWGYRPVAALDADYERQMRES